MPRDIDRLGIDKLIDQLADEAAKKAFSQPEDKAATECWQQFQAARQQQDEDERTLSREEFIRKYSSMYYDWNSPEHP